MGQRFETQDQNSQGTLGRKAQGQTRQLAGLGSALNLANMIELGARGQAEARKLRVHEVKAKWGAVRVRNKTAGTNSRDVLKPRQLPLPRNLRYASCQGKMQNLERWAQACSWKQGEEANEAQWPALATGSGIQPLSEKANLPFPSL